MVVSSAAAAVVDADKIREERGAVSSRDVRIVGQRRRNQNRAQARKPAGDKARPPRRPRRITPAQ